MTDWILKVGREEGITGGIEVETRTERREREGEGERKGWREGERERAGERESAKANNRYHVGLQYILYIHTSIHTCLIPCPFRHFKYMLLIH